MNLISTSEYKSLEPKEKSKFLDYLVYLKAPVGLYFFKNFSNKQKQDYIENRIKSADWLEDYEFTIMSNDQKQRYIFRKRFLTNSEFLKLNEKLQEYYLQMASYIKIQLNDSEFKILSPKMKKIYCNFTFEFPLVLDVEKVQFLSKKNQKRYIEKQVERGVSFSEAQYKILPPIAKVEYNKIKNSNLNEVRIFIRKILKETLC
tara:strand:+ start:1185 stop:1793 length:609 start_codon:yes stop_codon:yes gene_type:complete